MSVTWTKEQTQAITYHGGNLLVSAAAGSGKTAVLVERIIRMVTDPEHPADIDRLLIMTFTNAAAAEMRGRISEAIHKKLMEQPDDGHLQMQESLVHYAQITTIDSFCLNLIRTYFTKLDLDPSFRIGDEGELMLLQQDVMGELLEERYAQGDAEFTRFVDTFATGKSDAAMEELILRVYNFAQSNPYPAAWLGECREELQKLGSETDFETLSWVRFLRKDLGLQLKELSAQLLAALSVCRDDEILSAYVPMLTADVRKLDEIRGSVTLPGLIEKLGAMKWDTLARVRSKDADAEKKQYVTGCRDRAKKAVKKLQGLYAFAEFSEMKQDLLAAERPVLVLLELTEDFSRRYQEKKREKNVVDFNDLEHEALKVLIRRDEDGLPVMEGGAYAYTEVADELAAQYLEVMVDEYQDSNLVQEALICAVSAERFGRPNVFMVGDVKQSIYKFRLARPELFLEKYRTWLRDGEGAPGRMVELHQNFRSRDVVLAGVNDLFYRIMTESLGGIRYTEETALHPGAQFEPFEGLSPQPPELFVVNTEKEILENLDADLADLTAREIEARLIAGKIREYTDPQTGLFVWDKSLSGGAGGYRRAQYRDIVILLRSTAGWTETFLPVLQSLGIPACAESRTGYFNTLEVETVLSLLSVIDNPMQDIPLAAVLKSPMAGVTDEELAWLMATYRASVNRGQDRGIYAAVSLFLRGGGPEPETFKEETSGADRAVMPGEPEGLRERLFRFANLLSEFRRESTYLPIHELIYHVYERTGWYRCAAALPAGQTRQANLDMLVEKAAAYEKTSYKGLFHFIRYIENLKKYDTDFGEASVLGENDDTVRIMSIHKSKGLEFPVVILAGMGKKFNKRDAGSRILIDADYGIAADYLDPEYRVKAPTLKKNAIRRKLESDSLGEELRVLYVAMTRAKEKLVMTATDRSLEKKLERYGPGMMDLADGQVPCTVLSGASSYLDWVLMGAFSGPSSLTVQEVRVEELVQAELIRQVKGQSSRKLLEQTDLSRTYDAGLRDTLERYLDAPYPYEADVTLHTKMSVSELKKQGQMTDEAESVRLILDEAETGSAAKRRAQAAIEAEAESAGPAGTGEEGLRRAAKEAGAFPAGAGNGATRGTAYHRVLELLDYSRLHSLADTEAFLDELVAKHRLGAESRVMVRPKDIWNFACSGLGRRMARAADEGRLHREQQFVMGIPAREMGDYDSDELVVVQGIMDAYFEEDGELVLVDYKTDRVKDGEELLARYRTQLDYYERALSQMTGKRVKEKLIYSLTLGREIRVSGYAR